MSTYTTASYFASELVLLVMVAFNAHIRCAASTSCYGCLVRQHISISCMLVLSFATLLALKGSHTRNTAHGAGLRCLWQYWRSIQHFISFTQVGVA